jgi:hypothetical protein
VVLVVVVMVMVVHVVVVVVVVVVMAVFSQCTWNGWLTGNNPFFLSVSLSLSLSLFHSFISPPPRLVSR